MELKFTIMAYEPRFRGGVRVAAGDVNGDGLPDIIAVPGSGRVVTLKVFDGAPDTNQGNLLTQFDVFPKTFRKGAFVDVADFNGDGYNDIFVSADKGWLPAVGVVDGSTLFTGTPTNPVPNPDPSFFTPPNAVLGKYFLAMENRFRGGVRVSAGDINGDDKAEIVVGRGKGKTSTVKIFEGGSFAELATLTPFGPKYTKGLFVAVGDFNDDGVRDVIVGADAGWVPEVLVFSGVGITSPTPTLITRYLAYDPKYRGGVHVMAKTLDGGNPDFPGPVAIWTSPGKGNLNPVQKMTYNGALKPNIVDLIFEDGNFAGGVWVG
jgi:hypothetical protein